MRRAAVLAMLVAAWLTGCSSEAAEPPRLPTVSTSPTGEPTPSPNSVPAAVPPAALEATPQGAAAFARFFYSEVTRGYAEKDPEIIRRISAPGCSACERFIASMTAMRDEGETSTPVIYHIIGAEAPAFDGPRARVDVLYDSPEITARDKSGKVLYTEPKVTMFEEQLTLVRASSGWLVQEVRSV